MLSKIKETVISLIDNFGTNNPWELYKEFNIAVGYDALGSINGYYQNIEKIKIIKINCDLSIFERTLTLSHELGHAVLHENTNIEFLKNFTDFLGDKLEIEANTFAVELLLPDEKLIEYLHETNTIDGLSCLSGIPIELLKLKLKNFNP